MRHVIASVSSQGKLGDRLSETASLLDGLISSFDSTRIHLQDPEYAMKGKSRVAEPIFSRFPDLPTEIRDSIFNLSFQPYVVKLYTEDRLKVETGHDATGLRAAHRIRQRNDLTSSLMNTQVNSRIIFVNYRSVRTVPLFHVCRASREVAKSRYGLPSPNTLLFDPTIDIVRQCGQWPYPVTPNLWHVFGIDERPIYDFSQIKSLQLHIPGFSTGTGFCLPPNLLFNNSQVFRFVDTVPDIGTDLTSITAVDTISDSVTDLVNTLGWIETHMPHLEKLDFTICLKTCDKSLARSYAELLANKKQSIWVDLVNIRSCVVTVEESRSKNNWQACLPRLSNLSIQLVPDGPSTMYAWEEGEEGGQPWRDLGGGKRGGVH